MEVAASGRDTVVGGVTIRLDDDLLARNLSWFGACTVLLAGPHFARSKREKSRDAGLCVFGERGPHSGCSCALDTSWRFLAPPKRLDRLVGGFYSRHSFGHLYRSSTGRRVG